MTYQNCKRLLQHFNDLVDGTISPKHSRWGDVIENAKVRAIEMKKRLDWYESDGFRVKHNLPALVKVEETKTKSKGKK